MSLPPEVLLSDQTVSKYMASSERAGYVFLHTHLAVSHIDLYRFSLPGQRDKVSAEILRKLPREFIARSQKQAVAHAMCLGRFCDAIQTEVDQMHDTGKFELAGDYSTFQMSTHCVRVLLVALQYELYRDITDVTTAPLWRSVEVDEAHIRFLVDSVQRVTRPWCDILNVAQQAVCVCLTILCLDLSLTLFLKFSTTTMLHLWKSLTKLAKWLTRELPRACSCRNPKP